MMQRPALIFEYSPLFLVLCALAGIAYAYALYDKSGPWGKNLNKLLFTFRFLLVSLLAALLVSPILKQVQNLVESPKYVIAIDNSSSIASSTDSLDRQNTMTELQTFAAMQEEKGFDVEVRTISGQTYDEVPTSIPFDYSTSDLANFLADIKSDYEGRNLGGVLLASDGIYNEGIAPTFKNYSYELTAVGIGDTIPKADISITSLLYNKISYQGNKFPLMVEFVQKGFKNRPVTVFVSKDGTVIDSKTVNLKGDNQLNQVRFTVDAEEKGYQRYVVSVKPLENEHTIKNNSKRAYVEVIEGKENIALIAGAPHPDIKALRAAIESNSNYSFDQYILSLPQDRQQLNSATKEYDLLIYHHLPSRRFRENRLEVLDSQNIPTLIIFGGQADLRQFNTINDVLTLDQVPGEYDEVNGAFNQGFVNFKLSEQLQQTFTELPPIDVPFGKVDLANGTKTMLYQQVGSIVTNKPLIAFNEEINPKKAVVLGDGLWKWRLTSYVVNDSHEPFNELVTKMVQYLSSKEDRRKFKAYPIKNEFTTNERVVFDTEVYNDLYERVYGNKIELRLEHTEGDVSNYAFITNENNTRYTISDLKDGVYNYTASTILNQKRVSVSGELVVQELQVEDINLTADFNMLRELAANTGGNFFYYQDLNDLKSAFNEVQAQGIIHSSEQYLPFINLQWMFFLFLTLVSAEWFIRKYSGSY